MAEAAGACDPAAVSSLIYHGEQGLNDPGAVAKGISVALLTTAYGLIVAFFTQPFYNYFTSKVGAYTREIETASNILFETLDEMDSPSKPPAASGA